MASDVTRFVPIECIHLLIESHIYNKIRQMTIVEVNMRSIMVAEILVRICTMGWVGVWVS